MKRVNKVLVKFAASQVSALSDYFLVYVILSVRKFSDRLIDHKLE